MVLVVFSDNRRARSCFAALERSRKYSVQHFPMNSLSHWLKNGHGEAVVYLDVDGLNPAVRTRTLRRLARREGITCCVLDPKNSVEDPAGLFHGGATDYVNRSVFNGGISPRRVDEIVGFATRLDQRVAGPSDEPAEAREKLLIDGRPAIVSGNDWSGIQPAREYTFGMLLAEIDNLAEYASQTSERFTLSVAEAFRRFIEQTFVPYRGRPWIWHESGGLLLFPFNGRTCPAIMPCVRLVLGRTLDMVERFKLSGGLSFRLALHIGNTVYRDKGDTGHIVSDSVNFVHHLGQKYTLPGHFSVSKYAYELIPEELRPLFRPAGEYEDRVIYRMRLPIRPR